MAELRKSTGERTPWTLRGGRRGTSLVEILVVLVILIVGIFAVTRLFPEGMLSLGYSGNLTLANALVQKNEDFHASHRTNVPEGMVGIDPDTGLIRTQITPADIRSERPYLDTPVTSATGTPPNDPRHSGVNQVRRVIGERLMLPPPSQFPDPRLGLGSENVCLYRPLYTPIYSLNAMPGSSLGVQAYSGTPFRRVVIAKEPQTVEEWQAFYTLLDPYTYAVDYDNAKLYFLATGYERRFKIRGNLRAQLQNGRYLSTEMHPNNTVYLPAGRDADDPTDPRGIIQRFDLRVTQPGFERLPLPGDLVADDQGNPATVAEEGMLDPETEFLYRYFTPLLTNQPFSATIDSDPYQFKVYDPVFGLLGFNPRVASVPRHQGGGAQLVKVDYDVDDWQILREELVVPTELVNRDEPNAQAQFHSVKLAISGLKKIGDMEETINFVANSASDTFEHQGLVRHYPPSQRTGAPARPGTGAGSTLLGAQNQSGVDLVLVDLETGLQIDSRTLQRPGTNPDPNVSNLNGEIDYANGVIHLRPTVQLRLPFALQGGNASLQVPAGGRRFRIHYRSSSDFAVASMKPYSNYGTFGFHPNDAPNRLPTFKEYQPYPYGFVLFFNTDADKTVAVDYQWTHRLSGEVRMEVGELHQIQSPTALYPPGPPPNNCGGGRPQSYWVRVRHSDPQACEPSDPNFDPDVLPGSVRVIGVRGASFHTWVEWRDLNRFRRLQRSTILGG
ncbi:MAG: hypothetical protein ACK47B_00780 [Armatimonadota bacterium]